MSADLDRARAMLRDPLFIAAGRALHGRVYHRAHLISAKGVSALCYKRPRAIDMRPSSGHTWTTDDKAVTCPKCKAAIAARDAAAPVSFDFTGLKAHERELLTFAGWSIGCGRIQPSPASVRRLIDRGLLVECQVSESTAIGPMTVKVYDVPVAVHVAWCEHCSKPAPRRKK